MRQNIRYRFAKGGFFLAAMIGFVLVIGMLVMWLWNAIIPSITGWSPLNYQQSVGLLILCRVLFGGFGWHRARSKWSHQKRAHWRSKWSNMTPEEREAFKSKWKERCRR